MNRVKVNIVHKDGFKPIYSSTHAAGADIRADIEADIVIKPSSSAMIPTGIYIQLPEGFEAQIRPRSGLAAKKAVTVLNSPGTIDSDYRGEVKIILINHGKDDFCISSGDRIAQMIIAPVVQADFIEVDSLDDSDRGEGGFGSTGV